MKTLYNLLLVTIIPIIAFSQPDIEWAKCYGGSDYDHANSIQQTTDGGYIIAGYTESNDGDVSGNHGEHDYWIVKLDATGDTLWTKCLGGSSNDKAQSIQQTIDGGFIVTGYTESENGDISGNHGEYDAWVIKISGIGDIEWQKCIGGSINDYANSIQQTTDGGYIIAGCSESNDGDVTGNHGELDYWIVKLDATGDTVWTKCLGGSHDDCAYSIEQTTDGGYIILGGSQSNDGDVSGNHGFIDYWIVKLKANGDTVWTKCVGGSNIDRAPFIQQTTDGGYIIAGYTESNDGDVIGNPQVGDYWLVKLNSSGNIDWQKCLGGIMPDIAYCIQQTADGGYIAAGSTGSTDGDVSGNHGFVDYWIVKLDSTGDTIWTKCLGGSDIDEASFIQQTTDGGYIIAGYAESNDGDVSGNHGSADYWIVKLSPDSGIDEIPDNNKITIHPNPAKGIIIIEVGNIKDFTVAIVDIQGKIIYKKEFNSNTAQIDVSGYPKGTYIVNITGEDFSKTEKVVIY